MVMINFFKNLFKKPAVEEKGYYGVVDEEISDSDWLGSEIIIPRAPKGTQSFKKNGRIQYNQKEVSRVSCTVHGAMGAYSDLTGYKFPLAERQEIWGNALALGADPNVGWSINKAVDLVKNYVEDKIPVNYYRVALDSFEFGHALRMGYSVVLGFRGNAAMATDKLDGVLDETEFKDFTYAHCIRVSYSVGDEYDLMIDNYPYRETNLYRISTSHWRALVNNRVFFKYGYIYLIRE